MKKNTPGKKKAPAKAEVFTKEEFKPKPYSLELLANIATQIFVAGNFSHVSDCRELYWNAVNHAKKILRACQHEVDTRDARAESDRAWQNESFNLSIKYPDGLPYLKGLLYITGAKTEGDGLPLYKRWLLEGQFFRIPNRPNLTGEGIEKHIAGLRCNGFPILGIQEACHDFQYWKKWMYVPAVRRQSGRTPKKPRKSTSKGSD